MRADEFDLVMDDGVSVHLRRWRPDGNPRGVVQIAHGMSEHAGRYARLAHVLVGAGYSVWAQDHRGHGQSVADDRDLGHFGEGGGFARVRDDLIAVRDVLGSQEGIAATGQRVAVFAHSMGSFLTQAVLALKPPSPWDAVILAGSDDPGGIRIDALAQVARLERRRQGRRGQSPIVDKLAFGPFNAAFKPNRTDSDWLTRDEAEVDAFLADPRTGFRLTNQSWVDFLGGRGQVARAGFGAVRPTDLPVLLIAGDRDPVGRNGSGVLELGRKLRAAGLTDVEVRLYPDARHELVNETNRETVHEDVLAFLARAIG